MTLCSPEGCLRQILGPALFFSPLPFSHIVHPSANLQYSPSSLKLDVFGIIWEQREESNVTDPSSPPQVENASAFTISNLHCLKFSLGSHVYINPSTSSSSILLTHHPLLPQHLCKLLLPDCDLYTTSHIRTLIFLTASLYLYIYIRVDWLLRIKECSQPHNDNSPRRSCCLTRQRGFFNYLECLEDMTWNARWPQTSLWCFTPLMQADVGRPFDVSHHSVLGIDLTRYVSTLAISTLTHSPRVMPVSATNTERQYATALLSVLNPVWPVSMGQAQQCTRHTHHGWEEKATLDHLVCFWSFISHPMSILFWKEGRWYIAVNSTKRSMTPAHVVKSIIGHFRMESHTQTYPWHAETTLANEEKAPDLTIAKVSNLFRLTTSAASVSLALCYISIHTTLHLTVLPTHDRWSTAENDFISSERSERSEEGDTASKADSRHSQSSQRALSLNRLKKLPIMTIWASRGSLGFFFTSPTKHAGMD